MAKSKKSTSVAKSVSAKSASAKSAPAEVLFAPAAIERLEAKASLPAKFQRMLEQLPMNQVCEGAVVALKVHVGAHFGFTTIPPLFVRLLIEKIKAAGAKSVFVTDGDGAMAGAVARGYTAEVLGAPLMGAAGVKNQFFVRHKIGYKSLKDVEICGNIEHADALINLSHFKGHGDCGFGAACKNLAMGCVTEHTRGELHKLEGGGLKYNRDLCNGCRKCVESCGHNAASWNNEKNCLEIFFHNCLYCRHCVLACPRDAIKIEGGSFVPFQRGLALATREVLRTFEPSRVLHINFLTQITVFCDCWGFSAPALIPDVGILASSNIVAVDKASLDLTRDGQPLPGSLPPERKLVEGDHMMQRIHGKDPYIQVREMEAAGLGTSEYKIKTIK
jgi:uncharacterized protein